jgi:hypothetical protein
MNFLTVRRIALWVASLVTGVAGTLGTIALFRSSLDRFWTQFLFKGDLPLLLLLGFGSLAFIWGDWILQTQYLRTTTK